MKRWLSVLGVVVGLAVSAAPSFAQINLAWDNCGAAGTVDKAFACNTNSGTNTMVASFIAPAGVDLWTANELVLDIKSSTDPLPDWWRLRNQTGQLGQCRNNSLSADIVLGSVVCTDPYSGNGSGGIGTYKVGGPAGGDLTRVRLTLVFAIAAGSEIPLNPGEEYFAAKVNINNAKTVGLGSCAGCTVPMSITLNGVNVIQPAGSPGGDRMLTDPALNRTITWQGGLGAPALSTARTTWGAVKSLYR